MFLPAGGGLRVHCLPLGELVTNCWVLAIDAQGGSGPAPEPPATPGESLCWVVDPDAGAPLLRYLERKGLSVSRILLTHGHGDHLGGVREVKARFPHAVITAPAGDAFMLTDANANLSGLFGPGVTSPPADEQLRPGDSLTMGPLIWTVFDVSGHTPGGVAFYCEQAGVVVVGDALFEGSIGRTDFPGGDGPRLLRNIRDHLLGLPDATRVLPGHGASTTIGEERLTNPHLQTE